jgi:hypothetical protein
MKRNLVLFLLAFIATTISYFATLEMDDCIAGCIRTQGGFPINVIKDYTIDDILMFLNFLLWFCFFWIGMQLYKRINNQDSKK